MSYAETLLPEFDQEMASTRKVLERIPDDKLDWKSHPKSNTIGWNANHIADIPCWAVEVLTKTVFDIAPIDGEPHKSPEFKTTREIVECFDRNVAAAREAIAQAKDEDMGVTWTLAQGGKEFFSMPRATMMRVYIMNHLIHHRAHVCAYLRLNDIPVPGMYGPSGDE
ncbi:DinB family protein [Paludisphaera rhizosphaerae]|uniref:DinB family protein n=1 Tax=Paludisphaera rhizosphaerae TaxID=2711216 RepID=UPI0013E9D136|nr:DinB family protein [Paludisphaera rhizosphaerae]